MKTTIVILLMFSCTGGAAEPGGLNLICNPGFERGLRGWKASWRDNTAAVVEDSNRAHAGSRMLVLTAEGANVGVDSKPICVGADFDPRKSHVLAAWLRSQGITRGGFGLRFYCHDADGKYLGMKSIGNLGPSSAQGEWHLCKTEVGPGTEFDFPERTDHVVVRFSFWEAGGDCRGSVAVDDVFFGPADSRAAVSERAFRRTAKGAVAVWCDDLPEVQAKADPRHLADLLEEADIGVNLIDTRELSDRCVLDADRFDLLVMPYGEAYPAAGAVAIRRFLAGGGRLISLGGRCFRRPIQSSVNARGRSGPQEANTKPPRRIHQFVESEVASLARQMAQGDVPARVTPVVGPGGVKAIRVKIDKLPTYKYISLATRGEEGYTVLQFQARGIEGTRHLCVELNEADGSRWKAIVELTPDWITYELSTGQFASYATADRGGPGDYFRVGQARRVAFGFPHTLVGSGKCGFELARLEWQASDVSPQQMAHVNMLFSMSPELVRAFGPDIKPPGTAGDVTAFFGSQRFEQVSGLRAAPGQTVFSRDLVVQGDYYGWTATTLEDNLPLLRCQDHKHTREFLPTEWAARTVPLLLTPDGRPAAALFFNLTGNYADTVWACFGVDNRDLFPPGDQQMGQALVELVERMLGGRWLTRIQPRLAVADGRVRMRFVVTCANQTSTPAKLDIQARLLTGDDAQAEAEATSTFDLPGGTSHDLTVLEVDPTQFDWRQFRVECRLVDAGRLVDQMSTSLDVQAALLAVCERFVATQKERGDGKFSGTAFVDNRGARALLAAYDLTGDRRYLAAAIAWGKAIIAAQREDGGYLMGYGYYPQGNECYVADGGEIACGIARLVSYVPEDQRHRFLDSLAAYMRYRESFRCEGGGIGVGWCMSDYGVRPIKRLDKLTRIYAPEQNIYTIGCTLTAAVMHAQLTGNPEDNAAAVRDAYWWMERCRSTSGGAYVESAVWANKFLTGSAIKRDAAEFLRTRFLPHVTRPDNPWWADGGGRTVQGLDGLAYYYHAIKEDPEVLAALIRAAWHVASPQSPAGIPRVLLSQKLNQDQWRYLHFASVSLPELLEPGIVQSPF